MITAIIQFTAKPGQRDKLVAGLSKAIDGTLAQPDCYKADLLVDQDSDDKFAMLQHWMKAESHKAYVKDLMEKPVMQQMFALMVHPPQTTYYDTAAAGGGLWGGPAHLELSSADPAATKTFLSDVFNWQWQEWMDEYTGFWAPGALMGGLRPKMDEEPAPQTVPYLVVNDLEARLEAVTAAGGTIIVPIQEVPNAGRFFWFIAPGGLTLAAWESFEKNHSNS